MSSSANSSPKTIAASGQALKTKDTFGKRLYILRHAKSGEHSKLEDFARPLNERGKSDALLMAKFLADCALVPQKILCSPAARTKATVEILLRHWSQKEISPLPNVNYVKSFYLGESSSFLKALSALDDTNSSNSTKEKNNYDSILICGHNPALEEFISFLVAQDNLQLRFPTAALAIVDFPFSSWNALKKTTKEISKKASANVAASQTLGSLEGLYFPKLLKNSFFNASRGKKLRVAWVMDIFDEVSGIITDTKEIYHQARKKEMDWYPLTCYTKELAPFKVFKPEMKFATGKFYKGSYLFVPRFTEVVQYLKEKQVNLIVSNTPATMGLIAMSAAKFLKIPLVDIYHTDVDYYMDSLSEGILKPVFNSISLNFLKLYQKQADLIFVRTHDFYNLLIQKGHSSAKLRYYPAGVDIENFSPIHKDPTIWNQFNLDTKKKKLLFVGRITKVKDILFALNYFKNKEPANWDLLLVGTGPDLQTYQNNFSQSSCIHFLGAQQGETLRKIYASSHLLVLPSASETLGKTVLEAMASAITVVVSDKGGPKDYVDDQENGFIFKARDEQDFGRVMDMALGEQVNLLQMGNRAFEKISHFGMEQLFEKFITDVGLLVW